MPRKTFPRKETIQPTMSVEQAIPLIQRQIERLGAITSLPFNHPAIDAWESTTVNILNAVYGQPNGELHQNTKEVRYAESGEPMYVGMSDAEIQRQHVLVQEKRKALLKAYLEQLEILAPVALSSSSAPIEAPEIQIVKLICRRFHIVERQLTRRHENRHTLEIRDEYDVQDLLHALLRLHFDDVRPEEWTPSYAGGSSRMDFLLKKERLVIEAKMTRSNLTERQVSEQLIVDIARYRSHPDCQDFGVLRL
jgi:hypothetical protein